MAGLTYIFINDLNHILSHHKHFNSYFISESNNHPLIIQYLMRDQISIESVTILNMILGFTKKFSKVKNDIILEDIINKIDKYEIFVRKYHSFDEEKLKKFRRIVKEKAEESINVLPF